MKKRKSKTIQDGVSSSTVTAIEELLAENNNTVSDAPQQTANGLYKTGVGSLSWLRQGTDSRSV